MPEKQSPSELRSIAMEHHRAGRMDRAAEGWATAAKADPKHPETRNNLGVALQALGNLREAENCFAEAIRLKRDYADAWENHVAVLIAQDRRAAAIEAGREMVKAVGTPGAYLALATAMSNEPFADVVRVCKEGLALDPNHVGLVQMLGWKSLLHAPRDEAVAVWEHVVALKPDDLEALRVLGICLRNAGRGDDAMARFREIIRRDPNDGYAHMCLADSLDRVGDLAAALESARRAASLLPDNPQAVGQLATFADRAGLRGEAGSAYRRTLELDPHSWPATSNYATWLGRSGQVEQAVERLRREVGDPVAHSTLCMYLNAVPGADPLEVSGEHRRWARHHTARNVPIPEEWASATRSDRRLRIGYVSPDWAGHPVARFMQPILESHDRDAFEVHVYDDAPKSDAFTERLRPLAHAWHRIRGMPDEQVLAQIRGDGIDVLVDLAGHTANNRLRLFSMRPAPVQFSYCGYPNTTGLRQIDYRITDAIADPPGLADELHTEKLVRLPRVFLAFRPPVETPEVAEAPALRNGFVTFGSFNALWKVNPPLLRLWARVLNAVPGSRLIMKADGLEEPTIAGPIAKTLTDAGIKRDRLRLTGREPTYRGHLEAYAGCDVCLDTFPYAGTTTTCEALWMGVPVVTRAGEVHAGRVGASLLSSVDLASLVCTSDEQFVEVAAGLAADMERLTTLRLGMRNRLAASPLTHPKPLTQTIEHAYRQAWDARHDRRA